jgi:diacylglycerol kinase family enzyme
MTRVTLLHNPGAGSGRHSREDLLAMLRAAGIKADYVSKKDKGLASALREAEEIVLVAGGDGTVGRAAKHLIDRDVALAILPMGTANNIAKALGIRGDVQRIIRRLPSAARRRIDVGLAKGPWGKKVFIEGMGTGLFADVMADIAVRRERDPSRRTAYASALRAIRAKLAEQEPQNLQIVIDGSEVSGSYHLFEAMNIQFAGPNLHLAPGARLADGMLDIVLLAEERRREFDTYLDRRLRGRERAPRLVVRRGKKVQFAWSGRELHFDDKLWPGLQRRKKSADASVELVELKVKRRALELLVPK